MSGTSGACRTATAGKPSLRTMAASSRHSDGEPWGGCLRAAMNRRCGFPAARRRQESRHSTKRCFAWIDLFSQDGHPAGLKRDRPSRSAAAHLHPCPSAFIRGSFLRERSRTSGAARRRLESRLCEPWRLQAATPRSDKRLALQSAARARTAPRNRFGPSNIQNSTFNIFISLPQASISLLFFLLLTSHSALGTFFFLFPNN